MSKRSAPTLVTEKSYDSTAGGVGAAALAAGGFAGGRSKFFKLDRTYTDVIEDELYAAPSLAASATGATAASPPPKPEKRPGMTRALHSLYPDLFDKVAAQQQQQQKQEEQQLASESGLRNSLSRDQADASGMTIESSVRFEGRPSPQHGAQQLQQKSAANQRDLAVAAADKRMKDGVQSEEPTVSPKEAFLDVRDAKGDRSGGGNLLYSQHSASDIADTLRQTSSASESGFSQFNSLSQGTATQEDPASMSTTTNGTNSNGSSSTLRSRPYNYMANLAQYTALYGDAPPQRVPADKPNPQNQANSRFRQLSKESSAVNNNNNTNYTTAVATPEQKRLYPPSSSIEKWQSQGVTGVIPPLPPAAQIVQQQQQQQQQLQQPTPNQAVVEPNTPKQIKQNSNASAGDESNPKSGSNNKMLGPHRCDLINPLTGEYCGVEFSRPYDLVRHQDTIHRQKKAEFRCDVCNEIGVEKVFSRNDALVRHMRHVHKIELPSKKQIKAAQAAAAASDSSAGNSPVKPLVQHKLSPQMIVHHAPPGQLPQDSMMGPRLMGMPSIGSETSYGSSDSMQAAAVAAAYGGLAPPTNMSLSPQQQAASIQSSSSPPQRFAPQQVPIAATPIQPMAQPQQQSQQQQQQQQQPITLSPQDQQALAALAPAGAVAATAGTRPNGLLPV
ncbi:regulatory particle non-ATPase [Savitreella phatthalungensis]